MGFVYYLCFSNSPLNNGLVFPAELEPDIYSPGIWIVNSLNDGKLENKYMFDAISKDKVVECVMEKVNKFVYKVDTNDYGIYFFRLIKLKPDKNKYVGSSNFFSNENKFYQVVPININTLEKICQTEKFYFIGKIL